MVDLTSARPFPERDPDWRSSVKEVISDPEFPNKSQLGEPVGASWSYYIRVSQPHVVQLMSGAKVERTVARGFSQQIGKYPKNAIESWGN